MFLFYFHNQEPMKLEASRDVVSADTNQELMELEASREVVSDDTLNHFKRRFINDDEIVILKVAENIFCHANKTHPIS
jgi:hypothetical protein